MGKNIFFITFFLSIFFSIQAYSENFCKSTSWDNPSYARLTINKVNTIAYIFDNERALFSLKTNNKSVNIFLLDENTLVYSNKLGTANSEQIEELIEELIGKLRLVNTILSKEYPNGPQSITKKSSISLGSSAEDLEFIVDPGTKGGFGAPWDANGYILPISENKFQFTILFKAHDIFSKKIIMQSITGELDYGKNNNFNLFNKVNLADYIVSNPKIKSAGFKKVKTIEDLRKFLKEYNLRS